VTDLEDLIRRVEALPGRYGFPPRASAFLIAKLHDLPPGADLEDIEEALAELEAFLEVARGRWLQ